MFTHQFIPHPSLATENPVDVLRLIRSENVGPVTFFHLVKFCGSVGKALDMAPDMARRGGRKKPIRIATKAEAEKEAESIARDGAKLIVYGSADYPPLLLQAMDAPPLLIVKGHTHLMQHKMLSIVGARNASTAGISFARRIARELGTFGFIIVSGLARGIDTAAHTASIESGTIAVIAGGINTIYPLENESLYHQIAETGCIISEMPFGAQPLARSFPARNRIIAGMTQGMVIVEASLKSGSLISAQCAADYHRDVFAVPGSPLDPRAQGTNKLIKEGAILTESAADVIAHYREYGKATPLRESDTSPFTMAASVLNETELDAIRHEVREKLSPTPVTIDELITTCDKPASYILAVLLEYELAGVVERHAGGRVSLKINESGE